MSKFKVGDVCVIIEAAYHPQYIGAELTIEGAPFFHEYWEEIHYPTDFIMPSGNKASVAETCLKLKKPPQEFTGENRIMELFLPNNKLVTIEDIEKLEEVVV